MMQYRVSVTLAGLLLAARASYAEGQADTRNPRDSARRIMVGGVIRRDAERTRDPALEQELFPPDFVMQQQARIGLKEEQRAAILGVVREMQSKTLEGQWKLQQELDKLTAMIRHASVKESEAVTQLEQVLAAERDVKRTQMIMLIRIKNVLTGDQQAVLRTLRGGSAPKDSVLPLPPPSC